MVKSIDVPLGIPYDWQVNFNSYGTSFIWFKLLKMRFTKKNLNVIDVKYGIPKGTSMLFTIYFLLY